MTRTSLGGCLHEAFEDTARAFAGRVAVVDGRRELSYRELDDAANRIASRLRALGAGPGTLVGLCAQRSAELVAGLIAILKTGAGYLPLDPDYPPERLRYLLADAQCPLVLGQPDKSWLIAGTHARYVELRPIVPGEPDGTGWANQTAADSRPADPGSPAYVIYTSGSTGAPKGVMVPHGQVMSLFAATRDSMELSADDTWTLFHSFAFDFSVWEIWGALLFGGRLVVVPYATSRSPGAFLDLLRQQRITVLSQTPSAFYQLAEAASELDYPATSLRLVVFGGEALDPAQLAPWLRAYGASPRLINMYGITETTVHVTIRDMSLADAATAGSPIGRPLPHLRVHVLDPRMRPVPDGTVGEMFVGGDGVSLGYLNRPGLTAGRFVPDPFGEPGGRLYRTGDLAVRDARGELDFRGRIDDQVQLRGFRIELGEVEGAIGALPGIAGCAVVVQGTGPDARLVAFVAGDYASPGALRTELARRLPAHMIPSGIVRVAAIPLTPNGKADRRLLRSLTVTSRPDGLPYCPPANADEEAVARIWSEVLGIGPVGRTDSFLALGGNSLQATRITARIKAELGAVSSAALLFKAETVTNVAASLRSQPRAARQDAADAGGVAADAADDVPASSGQQRLVFLTDMNPGAGPAYNLSAAVRIKGSLDQTALRAALDDLAVRHDALRTALRATSQGVVAEIGEPGGIPVRLVDASEEHDPELAARQAVAGAAGDAFDLAKAPLMRAVLARLGPGDHLLAIVAHHAVADGWSLAILGDDLAECYRARVERRAPAPAPATGFADYARAQHKADLGGCFHDGLEFWERELRGAPRTLELPADLPRPDTPAHRGARVSRLVPPPLHALLLRFASTERVTVYAVLMASTALQAHRLTGIRDMVIGSPSAGRTDPGFEGTAGFFVNTLPIRQRIGAAATYRSVVRLAHDTIVQALDHQDVPFGRIVAAVAPEREPNRQPLVQVVVVDQAGWRFHPRLAGLATQPEQVYNGTSKFDMVVEIAQDADGMRLTVEYDTSLFLPPTAERFLDGLIAVLGEGLAEPSAPLPASAPVRGQAVIPGVRQAADAGRADDAPLGGPVESLLGEIWSEVLGVARIEPTENFFALGGDSIRALRVAAAARDRGLPVGVEQVFRAPTLAGLAALCGTGPRREPAAQHADVGPRSSAPLPDGVADIYLASSLQLGLIFQSSLSEDTTVYHDLVSVQFRGPLDTTLLQGAIDDLVARHEILRTTFDLGGHDEPMQLVHKTMEVPVRVAESARCGVHAVRHWWRQAWHEPFDLEAGPLLRCTVLRCPDGSDHLALSAHHSVLDGWSFSLLVTELLREYDALLAGAPLPPAPGPSVRYRDFVALERQAVQDPQASAFWRTAAAGRVPALPGPAEIPPGPALDPDHHAVLPGQLVSQAERLAERTGVPVKSVFLAAHLRAMAKLCADEEAVTGIVVNGRPEERDGDRALGLFLNSVPVRVHTAPHSDTELCAAAFEAEQRALAHRRFPLADIQRLCGQPCFQVLFNYADFHAFDPLAGLVTLRIKDWWFCDRTEVPLVVELLRRPLSDAMELNIRVNPAATANTTATLFASLFLEALTGLTSD